MLSPVAYLLSSKTKAPWFFLSWCLCFPFFSYSQNTIADSLSALLPSTAKDSHLVILLNDLAWELKVEQPDQARAYLQQSATLAAKINFPKGEAQAHNNRGVLETIQENLAEATVFYQKALTLRQQLGDQKGVASLYNNIGNLKVSQGDYPAALENMQQSLLLRQELKDTIRIARTCYNIALIHEKMGNYPEALDYVLRHLAISEQLEDEYEIANANNLLGNIKSELERFDEAFIHYEKALEIRQRLGEHWELAMTYNNLGSIYDDLAEKKLSEEKFTEAKPLFIKALDAYFKSLELYRSLEDEEGQSGSFNNIGLTYKNLGSFYEAAGPIDSAGINLNTAMEWLNQSLEIRKNLDDQHGIMEVYNGIGDVRRRQKNWPEALDYTQRYFAIALELDDPKFLQKANKDLSRIYASLGKYQLAYQYQTAYDSLRYARLDEDRVKQNLRREAIYGDIRKQHAIEQQQKELELQELQLQRASLQRKALAGGALGLFLLTGLLYNRYRLKNRANRELAAKNQIIEKERKRSDDLLLNILPAETAEELKQTGTAQARHYDSVTVLFTDFKSFTKIAEQLTPEELVAELDECFRAFDEITERYGVEKIKTIGDAYMCAGGLPSPENNHPIKVVGAALEMQEFMEKYRQECQLNGREGFEARIGIHTGPVVAGIVGSRKFAYDIWGDTVNLAARMESSGEVGEVNISQDTFELIKETFDCVPRGKVEAKNKGAVEMYFVKNRKEKI